MSTEPVDIEAFVKTEDASAVVSLLSKCFGALKATAGSPEIDMQIYEYEGVTVILQPVADGFLSVWARGNTPWLSCPALGRYLAKELHCTVLCDPGQEFPEISPYSDEFLEIKGEQERIITYN